MSVRGGREEGDSRRRGKVHRRKSPPARETFPGIPLPFQFGKDVTGKKFSKCEKSALDRGLPGTLEGRKNGVHRGRWGPGVKKWNRYSISRGYSGGESRRASGEKKNRGARKRGLLFRKASGGDTGECDKEGFRRAKKKGKASRPRRTINCY